MARQVVANNKQNISDYTGSEVFKTTGVSGLYKPRVVRDKKLVNRETISNTSGVHGIVLVPKTGTGTSNAVHINFQLKTTHTAETSTITATWGDGSTTTYTPDSSGNVAVEHTYDYNDTDLTAYDTGIKQAYFKLEATSDDIDFDGIDFTAFSQDSDYPQPKNHMIYELILKLEVRTATDVKIFPSYGLNQQLHSSTSLASHQFGLRYLEIDQWRTDGGQTKFQNGGDYQSTLQRVLINDGRGMDIGGSPLFDRAYALREFSILSMPYSGTNERLDLNYNSFEYTSLEYLYISTKGQRATIIEPKGEFFRNAPQGARQALDIVLDGRVKFEQNRPFGGGSFNNSQHIRSIYVSYIEPSYIGAGAFGGNQARYYGKNALKKEFKKNVFDWGTGNNTWTNAGTNTFDYNQSLEYMEIILPSGNRDSYYDHILHDTFKYNWNLKSVTFNNKHDRYWNLEEMESVFQGCRNLTEVNFVGLSGKFGIANSAANRTLDYRSTFQECHALTYEGLPDELKTIDMSSGISSSSSSMSSMFSQCTNLRKGISITVTGNMTPSYGTMFGSMYQGSGIMYIDEDVFDFSGITNTPDMGVFYMHRLPNLVSITGLDLSNTSGGSVNMYGNVSMVEFDVTYPTAANMFNLDFRYTNMSGDALDDVFTAVPDLTGETAKTITITNARGAADCDTSIATAKNYTVTN